MLTYNRSSSIEDKLVSIRTAQGFTDTAGSPFLGQIIQAVRDSLQDYYSRIYEIAENIDIGKASGEYLQRWGRFLNEPVRTVSYAYDMTLSNTYLYLDPDVTAGEITSDGGSILISAGTIIYDKNDNPILSTIDDVYIRSTKSRAFARVIAYKEGSVNIGAGSAVSTGFDLASVSTVLPSARTTYSVLAANRLAITGGAANASDEVYRYILQQKAMSIGLFNSNRVNTLLDIDEIVSIVPVEYFGGVMIFIDPRDTLTTDAVVAVARAAIRRILPMGRNVEVYGPITNRCIFTLQVAYRDTATKNDIVVSLKEKIEDLFKSYRMGSVIDLDAIISDAKASFPGIQGIRIVSCRLGSRDLVSRTIRQNKNEKATLSYSDITLI